MKNKKMTVLIILLILIILGLSIILFSYRIDIKTEQKPIVKTDIVEIKSYGYVLEKRDTKIYKDIFNELKTLLNSETVNKERYAELISKLYIIDVYTISNKISKYDVGGAEFVYPEYRSTFTKKLEDTLYKFVEEKKGDKRNQKLPEVIGIDVSTITQKNFDIADTKYNGFEVTLSWEYKEDLGYDKSCTLDIIEKDKFLYIIGQK